MVGLQKAALGRAREHAVHNDPSLNIAEVETSFAQRLEGETVRADIALQAVYDNCLAERVVEDETRERDDREVTALDRDLKHRRSADRTVASSKLAVDDLESSEGVEERKGARGVLEDEIANGYGGDARKREQVAPVSEDCVRRLVRQVLLRNVDASDLDGDAQQTRIDAQSKGRSTGAFEQAVLRVDDEKHAERLLRRSGRTAAEEGGYIRGVGPEIEGVREKTSEKGVRDLGGVRDGTCAVEVGRVVL